MFASTKDGKVADGKDAMANEGGSAFEDAKDAVRQASPVAKENIETVMRRTGHQAREWVESTEHNIEDMGGAVTAKIRRSPVQYSLIALGAGFLVGIFYRR